MSPVTLQSDAVSVAKQAGVWQVGYQVAAASLLASVSTASFAPRQVHADANLSQFRQLTSANYWYEQTTSLTGQYLGDVPVTVDGKQYVKFRTQLAQFRNLQRGWDTYDAEPPTPASCDLASRVMTTLQIQQMPLKFIVPTSDGSILLKHQAGHGSATWEIDGDGEIGVMIERSDDELEFLSVKSSEIDATVAKLAWNG